MDTLTTGCADSSFHSIFLHEDLPEGIVLSGKGSSMLLARVPAYLDEGVVRTTFERFPGMEYCHMHPNLKPGHTDVRFHELSIAATFSLPPYVACIQLLLL